MKEIERREPIDERDREERTEKSIDINHYRMAKVCDDCMKAPCDPCTESPAEKKNHHCSHYCPVQLYTIGTPQLIMLAVGMILYIADVTSDLLLAHGYFKEGHYVWGGLTVTFVAVPALITALSTVIVKLLSDYDPGGKLKYVSVFCYLSPVD